MLRTGKGFQEEGLSGIPMFSTFGLHGRHTREMEKLLPGASSCLVTPFVYRGNVHADFSNTGPVPPPLPSSLLQAGGLYSGTGGDQQ